MKSKLQQSLLILFLITSLPAMAQRNAILFSKMDSLNGTPLGKINAITQDPSGIMWFAGNGGNCLYRYDGSTLTSYSQDNKNPNSPGFKSIETVYADKLGMIWLGGAGLDKYDPRTGVFTHYKNAGKYFYGNEGVVTIFKDDKDNVWVGTFQGLERLDEKTGEFFRYLNDSSNPKSLSNNVVNVIYEDKKGVLWFGTGLAWDTTAEGGLNRMNPDGSFTRFMHDPANRNSLLSNKIRAIFEDSRGNFWVGTSGEGLHRMNREKGTFEKFLFDPKHPDQLGGPAVKPGHFADGITFISEDKSGALWIGTYQEGLSSYNPDTKKMTRYKMGNGFPDSTTFKGFISRDGTLWVASEISELLYKADPGSKTINNINTGTPVYTIQEDKGKLWVGSQAGLFLYDRNLQLIHRFRHDHRDPNSILNDTIWWLYKIPKDNMIWVGTMHGIQAFNTNTNKFSRLYFSKAPGLSDCSAFVIMKDENSNLWIGTLEDGLIRYNCIDGSVKQWLPDPRDSFSIGSKRIATLYEDQEQNIWLGTCGGKEGTWKFDPATGRFHNYLPGKMARNFYQDHQGVFWACTNYGLFRYNKKEDRFVAFFDSQSEISNEMTVGITEDREDNLWLSTRSSIVKVNRERNSFFVMGKKFGISAPAELFIGAFCKTPDNRILAGNDSGFYAFSPEELDLDMHPLKLVISDFFLSNAFGSSGKDSSLVNLAEKTSTVTLAHDQNNFGIEFSANDYRSSESVRYYTLLENYDPVWRRSGVDRIVHYFNLAPGDYLFRLKAYNRDESKGERQIRIHISPPWWKTIWAYLFFAVFVLSSTLLIYRSRILSLKKRQTEQIRAAIHAQEEERKRISRDLHDDIGTKLSALKLFISSLGLKARAIHHDEIASLAQYSEQYIQEVVKDLRKLLINLSPTVLEDFGYTNAVEGLANKINETKLIHFALNVFGFKKRLQKDYELALYRITQELINNILKHADAKNISLQTGQRDDKIVLIIEDDGKGFDVDQHKEGYGLRNLETRTKLLNGKMIIESTPGKGTTTLIEIPYNLT